MNDKQAQTETTRCDSASGSSTGSALDWPAIANWLYAVLDDIDAADDHARSDDAKYRSVVNRLRAGVSPRVRWCYARCQIGKDSIKWSEPETWRETQGVEHSYCYGCSDV